MVLSDDLVAPRVHPPPNMEHGSLVAGVADPDQNSRNAAASLARGVR